MSDERGLDGIELFSVPRSEANFVFYSYPQADRLLEIHRTLGGSGRGRRHNLEVLNKSAIVLTCAFWEAFVEDLTADALLHFAEHAKSPQDLPVTLRKTVLNDLRAQKNELAMWDLAGEQWRELLRERAARIVSVTDRTLSSPTSRRVSDFFLNQSGIDKVATAWHWPGTSMSRACDKLDAFVSLRNAIAHRGGLKDGAVLRRDAVKGLILIDRLYKLSVNEVDMQLIAATRVPLVQHLSLSEFASDDDS